MSFAYHAQAIGLSGIFRRPLIENIPGLASVSLSQTGGESYATVRDFNWKGLITFDEASAYVNGSANASVHNTLSTVTVRNLNVANMVHADLVIARVSSLHKPNEQEPRITFAGSMIRNLTIAGETVDVGLDSTPFEKHLTYKAFLENVPVEQADAKATKLTGSTPPFAARRTGDVVTASLVAREVNCRAGDEENRYVIHIRDFGTIYIAQVIMKPSYRRVSMLRFELGSPIDGSLEVAGGETNGSEYWP